MHKQISPVLILVAIIVLALGAGFALVKSRKTSSSTTTPTANPVVSPTSITPSPTSSASTSPKLETYSNKEHGYSLQYPSNWTRIVDTTGNGHNVDFVLNSSERTEAIATAKQKMGFAPDATYSLIVRYYDSAADLPNVNDGKAAGATSLEDYLKSQKALQDAGKSSMVIAYKPAQVGKYSGYDVDEPNIGGINFYYLQNNGHIYIIQTDDAAAKIVIDTFEIK